MRLGICHISLCILVAHVHGQLPGPPSLIRAIDQLQTHSSDPSHLRRAVRENWLSQHASHIFEETGHKQSKLFSKTRSQAQDAQDVAALEPLVATAIAKLTAAGPTIACPWDNTVHNSVKHLHSSKFLLAANLKDNWEVLPHIIREIWKLTSVLPATNLYISIYESGSADGRTGQWLAVLSRILQLMDVPHRIVTEGTLQRGEGEGRIDFLSKVRNKALEPLWLASSGGGWGPAGWPADRIVYMNDVFACARDFVRLMLNEEDMVCAVDFWLRSGEQEFFDLDNRQQKVYSFAGHSQQRHLKALSVYDLWVLRDSDGHMFAQTGAHSNFSTARWAAGLPFPVTTCWNGMVVLPAKPFQQGLRFRNHVEGECRASECSLVCHDLHRLGYNRIVLDPGVQLAYEHKDAAGLHVDDVVGNMTHTSWEDVRQAPKIDAAQFQGDTELCCNEDELNWGETPLNCQMRSFMNPNFTQIAFPAMAS